MNSARGSLSWSPPVHGSRIGASHRRRRIPCQDASLSRTLISADGQPLFLMAVADGHGGTLHRLSHRGSQLACQVAVEAAARHFTHRQPWDPFAEGAMECLKRELIEELALQIVNDWLNAVKADWQSRQGKAEVFSPYCYGTTLGLVMLTPRWWGHTGLGDWDLVLLDETGDVCFVSQEAGDDRQGEATASLCLPEAQHRFAERSAVYALDDRDPKAFGLVLSTDGVRKSCATDSDHLELVRYLMRLVNPDQDGRGGDISGELEASLDRITAEGSGDDVTVAMAWFGDPGGLHAPVSPAPPTAGSPSMRWQPALLLAIALAGSWWCLRWGSALFSQPRQLLPSRTDSPLPMSGSSADLR
ncbi:MAG: PP2C family serine/threonine-protein phosphatase [Cyanobacteriota bacterium]|nr:PP2C family serine/threonine-protein phosphatase [Cyanobacteriota bacterium]